MSKDKNNSELKKKISDLETELERSQRELCEGVRDWLDLRDAYKKVHQERTNLKEAAVKAITAAGGTTEEHAKDMLDAWFKTISDGHDITEVNDND
jgi:molecular chaperone GrpE (heat shock protein)